MHDSMMIADVGDIEKVRGSRMATPLAPPRPGSTPISTPSVMPTIISSRFIGVRMTLNPWSRDPISFMRGGPGPGSVAEESERVQHALVQRHLEPDLEHGEEDGAEDQRHDHAL